MLLKLRMVYEHVYTFNNKSRENKKSNCISNTYMLSLKFKLLSLNTLVHSMLWNCYYFMIYYILED